MAFIEFPDRPFTTEDAQRRGLSRQQLHRAVAEGLVRRVVRGAYLPMSLADTAETRAAAVSLVVAHNHVVVDRTAAAVHGVDTLTWAEHDHAPPVETCALRGHNPTRRTGVEGRTRDLTDSDVMLIGGIRVTTPRRTALDLGCNLRRREALAAMNALARAHGLTSGTLLAELPRFRGRRGVIQLRELAPLVDPRIESQRESWTLVAFYDAGLPLPEPQYWIVIDGVPRFRLDFAYPHARVCVEYDGYDFHERTPEQKERDRERRQWLRDHGWTVIVLRRGDFTGEALERWLRELGDALQPAYSNRRW